MQKTMQRIDLFVQIAHAKHNNVVAVKPHPIIWEWPAKNLKTEHYKGKNHLIKKMPLLRWADYLEKCIFSE
jgi:hypothetical protein